MRSPSVHSLFGLSNQRGLSNFLSGDDQLDTLLQRSNQNNLVVMAAGPQPPSSPELLSGDRLIRLFELLASEFDSIVIDCPPVMGLADAPLIASRVEGVVFVIEAHGTNKNAARVALSRLRGSNASVIGGVLTKFNAQRAHYGYGYDYGYGYGYGETTSARSAG
jgi:capsular exopolysaccharide synthesis family protein